MLLPACQPRATSAAPPPLLPAPAMSRLHCSTYTNRRSGGLTPLQYQTLRDDILAYQFDYPVATVSGRELPLVLSRRPEKYSSAAPLTADARQVGAPRGTGVGWGEVGVLVFWFQLISRGREASREDAVHRSKKDAAVQHMGCVSDRCTPLLSPLHKDVVPFWQPRDILSVCCCRG